MGMLKNISKVTKEAEVEFTGLEGFKVRIAAISRKLSKDIKEEATITKFDKNTMSHNKELDEELFIDKFTRAAVKGWSGLKLEYLPELMLVDLSLIDDEEGTGELEYSHEDAVELVMNSSAFDHWLNEVVFDLERFRD
jgi:hypothetical protein